MTAAPARYAHSALLTFAGACLEAAGVDVEIAQLTATRIVAADLAGHDTHGLALLPRYLDELQSGLLATSGTPRVLVDRGAALTWDAVLLPGHWVLARAMAEALDRAAVYGTATVAVRRSGHVGALQVHLEQATERGMMVLIWATDAQVRSVAPFGGLNPVLTSEPLAAGIPTSGAPILVDTTTSLASNGLVRRARLRGDRLSQPVLLDAAGNPSDDPAVLTAEPPGTILPLGGLTHGHKGFALGLLVATMALAVPGWGRTDGEKCQGFLLQVLDPDAFGGRAAFLRETDALAATARGARVRPGDPPVRLPGDGARARRAEQSRNGVRLEADVVDGLRQAAAELGVDFPPALPAGNVAGADVGVSGTE